MASHNSDTDESPVSAAEEEVGKSSYTETRDQYALVHSTESNDLEVSDPIIVDKSETILQTQAWVRTNYILKPKHDVHRKDMHDRYEAYCKANELQPVNLSSFGKIVRNIFPNVGVKRLEARGQTQFFYHGIRERNEDEANAHQPAVNSRLFLCPEKRGSSSRRTHPVQSPPLNILKFIAPSIPSGRANQEIDNSLIISFTTMYETHCQEIFRMVSSRQLERIQTTMHSFYQDMSPTFKRLVHNTPELIDAICRWDSSLYDFMIDTFFPSMLSPLSTDMRHTLKTYAKKLTEWQKISLINFPEMLYQKKTDVARKFSAKIDRQLLLKVAAENASSVLADQSHLTIMCQAWNGINWNRNLNEISHVYNCDTEEIRSILITDIYALLNSHPAIEHWMHWMSTIVDKYLRQHSFSTPNEGRQYVARCEQFMLKWHFCTMLIERQLNLQQPESADPFTKLSLFLEGYFLYLIEERIDHAECTLMAQRQQEQTQQGLQQSSDPSVTSTVELLVVATIMETD